MKLNVIKNPIHSTDHWVLLQGWAMSVNSWQPFIDAVPSTVKVSVVDTSSIVRSVIETGLSQHSRVLDQLAILIPPDAVLIGWSLGGMIACQLADRCKLKGLVTLASNACFVQQQDWPWAMPPAHFNDFYQQAKDNSTLALKRFSRLQCQGDHHVETVNRYLAYFVTTERDCLLEGLEWLSLLDNREVLSQTRGLHFFGECDALVPSTAASSLAKLGNHTCEIVVGAGHFLHALPKRVMPSLIQYLSTYDR